MMSKRRYSVLSLLVVIALLSTVLTACSKEDKVTPAAANISISTTEKASVPTNTPTDVPKLEPTVTPTISPAGTPTPTLETTASKLDETQRNSIGMLNYLTVLTQEVRASNNSRLYLEDAYSSLINNTFPNAVDNRTLTQLNSILDTLENYRMVSVKRDRLEYIYEQNRAQALREALPNPLGLLSAVQSFSLSKIAASIVYMAVDSYTSYTTYTAQADLQYLKDGWALDDDEATALHNSRKDMFSYMVRVVGEYYLPGDLALSEKVVDEFVEWKNNGNVVQRIQFLKSNRVTYQALGAYWLLLAQSYYDNGDYGKCLEAVTSYEELSTRIYRKDYGLSKVLPLAIVAAEKVLGDTEYTDKASQFAEKIISSTDNDEWSLRYFAAQTYVELYAKSENSQYLQRAYGIVLDNVNYLVNEQKKMNTEYLADLKEAKVPKGATKEEKAEIGNFNKQIKEERKTALAPIYEPLRLNCDLLFALAQKLNIPDEEKVKIDNILHEKGERIFLVPSIDDFCRFNQTTEMTDVATIEIRFKGEELTMPAKFVSGDAIIRVTVTAPNLNESVVFEDWAIVKVERKEKGNQDSFTVTFKSPTAEKYDYQLDSTIKINVAPKKDSAAKPLEFSFATVNLKDQWWEHAEFWSSGIGFDRVKP